MSSPTPDKKTPEGKKTKKTVEDKTTEDKKTPEGKKVKKTVEDKTTEDKKTPEAKKVKKTVEDKTTEDKKKLTPKIVVPKEMLGSKETLSKENLSKENMSKESTFEYEDIDVRTLEKDAFDVDSAASTGGSSELLDTREYSARDTDDAEAKSPVKHSILKKKLFRIIKTVVKKKYQGERYNFNYNDVAKTLRLVKAIFAAEPVVMTVKAPAVVVGDIHGQFADLCRIFSTFNENGTPGYFVQRYVFLGDYVDRGHQSLEVLMLLFWLKILFPKQIVMLRGNHEFRVINKVYGFQSELQHRFNTGVQGDVLFEQFNDVFNYLPLCCFVGYSIICMHGGISSKMKSRADLMSIPKPLRDHKEHPIACDLMWADPMINLKGEKRNNVRGVSVYFGEDILEATMAALDVKLVVRGHQMMQNGFNFYHSFRLVTVFSASSYYPDKPNRASVLTISKEGRVGFKIFVPLPKDHPANKAAFLLESHDKCWEDGGHAVNKDAATGAKPALAKK